MIDAQHLRWNRGTILNIILGLMAIALWVAPAPKPHVKRPHHIPVPVLLALPPVGAGPNMQQLITRPPFTQSRRPPAPAPVHADATAPLPPAAPTTNGLVLLGVLHAGPKAVALVALPGSTQPQEVVVGANLGDWVVEKILTDRLLLRSGAASAELVLPQPAVPPPANAAPAGMPQPFPAFPRTP